MTTGAELIHQERIRQIGVEGYDSRHDREDHSFGELGLAAIAYLGETILPEAGYDLLWPWHASYWKFSGTDPVRNLVKAGALIAAEIDRRQAL